MYRLTKKSSKNEREKCLQTHKWKILFILCNNKDVFVSYWLTEASLLFFLLIIIYKHKKWHEKAIDPLSMKKKEKKDGDAWSTIKAKKIISMIHFIHFRPNRASIHLFSANTMDWQTILSNRTSNHQINARLPRTGHKNDVFCLCA